MSSLVYHDSSYHSQHALSVRYALALLEAYVVYAQTISDDVGQSSLQSVPPQLPHVYHHSGPGPSLCGHISISTCAYLLHLTVGYVASWLANILCHTTSQVASPSYRTCLLAFVALSCHKGC